MRIIPRTKRTTICAALSVFAVVIAAFALLAARASTDAHADDYRPSHSATASARNADFSVGQTADDVYRVTDFTAVADDDWKISDKSDAANASVRIDDGALVVNAANAAASLYYGALLPINPTKTYKSFTFELAFKVNKSNGDNNRWLGIVYRSKAASANTPVSGYVMNYRLNGKNAYAAINANRAFRDIDEIPANGRLADGTTAPTILDGEYHRITITMDGDDAAKHYIDGHLVREAKTADQTAHLGAVHTEGAFALIVNSMEITIKSCTITPDEIIVPQITPTDDVLVSTYQNPDIKIVNAPTVVCDVVDATTLNSLGGTEKPSNAILRLNKDANVVDAQGVVLGAFSEVYAALDHKVIPVVRVDDDGAANALVECLTETQRILDLAVMSDKPELVGKVRALCPKTRGIIEYTAADFYTDGALDIFNNIVGNSNAHRAMTVVVPQSAATADNVRYIQARFKTVWVRPDSDKPVDIFACINSGAYGVVGNFGKIYDALETYPHSYTRMPYNVAHRGKHSNTAVGPYENSLASVQAAIDCGATHLELDGHMTRDGNIVIMHDDTLDRTTTGTGRIPDKTLEEIRRYKLLDGSQIPILEDVLDLLYKSKLKGKDIVFVFELKAGKNIAEKINSLLGTGDGQYDVRDNLVIITFNGSGDDILTDIKTVMPTTPTAYLQNSGVGAHTLANDLASIGYYNCGLDTGYSAYTSPEYDKSCLTDRGIAGWFWTFGNVNDVILAAKNGHLGLTNNAPDALTPFAVKIECDGFTAKSLKVGDRITVTKRLYSGNIKTDDAAVITYCEETEYGWTAIAALSKNDITLYTMPFTVKKSAESQKHAVKIYDGDELIYDETHAHGDKLAFTPPSVGGRTFEGYYADAEFTTPASLPATVTENVTLYAKYAPVASDIDADESKLGAGAIAGIALGCAGGAALVAGGATLIALKRRKRKA